MNEDILDQAAMRESSREKCGEVDRCDVCLVKFGATPQFAIEVGLVCRREVVASRMDWIHQYLGTGLPGASRHWQALAGWRAGGLAGRVLNGGGPSSQVH